MSWLIEEESIDRFVLDDIGGNLISGHFEHAVEESGGEHGESVENDVGNLPPMDAINLRNGSSVVLDSSNIIIDVDQESIHSGITILPSCSSSVTSHQEQVASTQDSPNMVSMIYEADVALSFNVNSIDSSILTEFSGSHLISSVNSCVSSEPIRGVATGMDVDDATTDVPVGSVRYEYNPHEDESKNTHWYNRFKSEEEWDEFQEKTKLLLDAVDCPTEERNEQIAQLISMEEQLFWNSHEDQVNDATMTQTPKLSWLLEVVALSASVAVAGVVIARYLKCR